jgi:hypothetical protein
MATDDLRCLLRRAAALRGLRATILGTAMAILGLAVADGTAWFMPLLVGAAILLVAGLLGPRGQLGRLPAAPATDAADTVRAAAERDGRFVRSGDLIEGHGRTAGFRSLDIQAMLDAARHASNGATNGHDDRAGRFS